MLHPAAIAAPTISRAGRAKARLGESPAWDPSRGLLWWLDIPGAVLHRYDPADGSARAAALPCRLTAIACRDDGRLIACGDPGIVLFDPATNALEILAPHAGAMTGMRCNDGALAPDGGFWFGTMAEDGSGRPGALFRFDLSTGTELVAPAIAVPNGPAFLTDGRAVVADTAARTLLVFDPAAGARGWDERRVLATFTADQGKPDGMTVDDTGGLWVALWDGGCLRRIDKGGRTTASIALPVPRPTSCAIGGRSRDRLYATTAARADGIDDGWSGRLLEIVGLP